MKKSIRLLMVLAFASILTACSNVPLISPVGELPQAPANASVESLLQAAGNEHTEAAESLRLSAADMAYQQKNIAQSATILEQVQQQNLTPAQQIFFGTLTAELEVSQKNPSSALNALNNSSFNRLNDVSIQQQIRTHQVKAVALEQNGQILDAMRERILMASSLTGSAANSNHEDIWHLTSSLPENQMNPASAAQNEEILAGWLSLGQTVYSQHTISKQQQAIKTWQANNPTHPAAIKLPQQLQKLLTLSVAPIKEIALLLPTKGPLKVAAQAIRNGFMAAHLQAEKTNESAPNIHFYDSSKLTSIDTFYTQAKADNIQLVVGPLEKGLVTQLSSRTTLPIPTLALNYSENSTKAPEQLYQFGLSAEDEARAASHRAWSDGRRRAIALVPNGDWGKRTLNAFREDWQKQGGTLIASEYIGEPAELAQQIAKLLKLRESETRTQNVEKVLDTKVNSSPKRRQDADFVFLAATAQQAQQIKPILAFQYAGKMPVYATSRVYTGNYNKLQFLDLDGIQFCETPWLLDKSSTFHQEVIRQWPEADTWLGRLYAMGIDANNIAPHLNQLKLSPKTAINGLTGKLTLNSQRQIVRHLPWAEFNNGQIKPLFNKNE